MKQLYFTLTLALLSSNYLLAQDESVPGARTFAGLSLAAGNSTFEGEAMFYGALSLHRTYPVALKNKLRIGFGPRFTSYYGVEQGYVTAPADVTEGNLFQAQNPDKLDTLFILDGQVNSLNAAIYIEYDITPKLSAVFSIDAIGVSFGSKQDATFLSSSEGNQPSMEVAKVSNFNLLLTGDLDLGSLNSELNLRYQLNSTWHLRGGISFIFTEYTTQRKLTFENDRFRNKSLAAFVGVNYTLGR